MRAPTNTPIDLSLIGPYRRERSRLGKHRRAGLWLTLADAAGMVAGIALAAALILVLLL